MQTLRCLGTGCRLSRISRKRRYVLNWRWRPDACLLPAETTIEESGKGLPCPEDWLLPIELSQVVVQDLSLTVQSAQAWCAGYSRCCMTET